MKKRLLFLTAFSALLFSHQTTWAQWTTSGADIYNSNTGNIGIGTTTPLAKLHIFSGSFQMDKFASGSTSLSYMILRRARGTAAAPTVNIMNDGIGRMESWGYDGTNYVLGSYIESVVASTPATNSLPANMNFATSDGITSPAVRLRIFSNGYVGVGNTVPAYRFAVSSNGTAPTAIDLNNSVTIGVNGVSSTNKFLGQLGFVSYDAEYTTPKMVAYIGAEATETYDGDTKTGSLMRFYTGTNAGTNPVERMVINNLGNVGVGTSTPGSKLDVSSATGSATIVPTTVSITSTTSASDWSTASSWGNLDFVSKDGSGPVGGVRARIGATMIGSVTGSSTGLVFYTSSATAMTETMRLDEEGNLSIGTTDSKTYKFAVNGKAIATSMTVKAYANWPDFVFKPNYKLPALNDVKNYIDKNRHLPEMPSQKEVEKNGVDLGEMNRLLLKKVEELTLYVVANNKELQEQKKQIDQLKKALKHKHR